jgi:hypothetical protein
MRFGEWTSTDESQEFSDAYLFWLDFLFRMDQIGVRFHVACGSCGNFYPGHEQGQSLYPLIRRHSIAQRNERASFHGSNTSNDSGANW